VSFFFIPVAVFPLLDGLKDWPCLTASLSIVIHRPGSPVRPSGSTHRSAPPRLTSLSIWEIGRDPLTWLFHTLFPFLSIVLCRSITKMADFFDTSTFCATADEKLRHRDITDKRCKGCGLRNPSETVVQQSRLQSDTLIDDDAIDISSTEPSPARPLPHRVITMPGTYYPKGKPLGGIVEVNRRAGFIRKPNPLPPLTIHFRIYLAKPSSEPTSQWESFRTAISRSEGNRKLTYDEFHESLWAGIKIDLQRTQDLEWLSPEDPGR
jgi:hypothetical protein